jgi:hypothetical protein
MKKITFIKSLLFIAVFGCFSSIYAQEKINDNRKVFGKTVQSVNPETGHVRCASTEYNQTLSEKYSNLDIEGFEQWLAPKIAKLKEDRIAGRSGNAVVRIPVVVHVIHSGQAIGTERNISNLRVQSQITVLNQDFRRMIGTPGFNSNPVGADMEIEFYLAQTGPDGELTTGIDRVNLGTTNTWNENNVETILKPQTSWDPKRYFNIWVCQFGGNLNGVFGYAQFPHQSGLLGLDELGTSATDGLICDWRAFGSSVIAGGTYYQGIDRGRTATHEIGHCFGLRHIWGDNSSCTVDLIDGFQDFCPDTPAASTEHYDCATVYNSCPLAPGNDMTENYMDYSNDTCFNTFTLDQKNRVQAVLQNSPRRVELPSSQVENPGQTYAYNARLTLSNLNKQECSPLATPAFVLKNTGTTTMTSATITYNINGGTSSTYNWTGSLATNTTTNISLPAISYGTGIQTFNASVLSINNGNADQYSANDLVQETFDGFSSFNTPTVTLELQRDAYGAETRWNLFNVTTNTTIASGGPYQNTSPNIPNLYTQSIPVALNNCYRFTITDTQGDGICCTYGSGYYNLKTSTGDIIATGGTFTSQEVKSFRIQVLNTKEFALNNLVLYPNPTQDLLNIAVSNSETPDNYTIYNSLGQVVKQVKTVTDDSLKIDTSNYASGIYMILFEKNNQTKTLQFIKN